MKQQYVTINKSNGTSEEMTIETYTRWLCLVEALDVITQVAERKKIDLNNNDWVKPIALQKYINERYLSMLHDVKCEEALSMLAS
jgi:hypothetical protein